MSTMTSQQFEALKDLIEAMIEKKAPNASEYDVSRYWGAEEYAHKLLTEDGP